MGSTAQLPLLGRGGGRQAWAGVCSTGLPVLGRRTGPGVPNPFRRNGTVEREEGSGLGEPGGLARLGEGLSAMKLEE